MRLVILYIVYGIVAIVLESTWLSDLPTDRYHFDFLLIGVAYLGFSQDWKHALPIVAVFGILYDVASAGPFGMALASYIIIYLAIRLIIAKITYQSIMARFGWIAIASVFDKAVCALLLFMWGYDLELVEIFLTRAPIQALVDSTLGLVMIPFLKWYSDFSLEKIFRPKGLVLK